MTDATTGQTSQTMTIDSAPVYYAVEAGYAADGSFVFDQTALAPPSGNPLSEPVDVVRSVHVRNGRFELRDAAGQPLFDTGGGNGPTLQSALGDAAVEGAIQLVDGVVLPALPQTGLRRGYDGSDNQHRIWARRELTSPTWRFEKF